MDRRAFFSQLGSGKITEVKPLLPPYSLEGAMQACEKCPAPCIASCETDILFKNKKGVIEVDFKTQGCTYCNACLEVCDKDVLTIDNEPFIQALVYIQEDACLAHNSVMCFSCKEPCLENAIIFEGLFEPKIDMQLCTSCGFCISRCPSNAIKVVA